MPSFYKEDTEAQRTQQTHLAIRGLKFEMRISLRRLVYWDTKLTWKSRINETFLENVNRDKKLKLSVKSWWNVVATVFV